MLRLIAFALFLVMAVAPPGPQTFTKDTVFEKTVKILGMGANGDIDILEVEKNANFKADVLVHEDLHVMQNATVDQGLTVTQGATVGDNVGVGGNLGVEGDTTLGGNILLEGASATISAIGDFIFSANLGADKKRKVVTEYAVYTALTGLFSFNGGKLRYDPVTGINANDGSMTINSANGDTELDIKSVGETTLQRKTSTKCALLLEEHPSNTGTDDDLLVVKGRSNFRDQMRLVAPDARKRSHEPLLVIDGDIEVSGTVDSPGNIKDRAAVINTLPVTGNLTVGEVFSVTASCSGTKKATGGGCTIFGLDTFGLVQRKTDPKNEAYECEYMEIFENANGIDATISSTVFCVTSV